MGKSLHKITQLSDESLVGQWLRTGSNDYVSALLLRYVPMIFGFFMRETQDAAKAKAEVRLFIQRFPSLLRKYGGREDFASWLDGELGTSGDKGDTVNGQGAFPEDFAEGCAPDDSEHAEIIAELEREIQDAYPEQRKRHTGLVIFVATLAVVLLGLFIMRTCKKPELQEIDVALAMPADTLSTGVADDRAGTETAVENSIAEPENVPENIEGNITETIPESVADVTVATVPDDMQAVDEIGGNTGGVRLVSISKDADNHDDTGVHYVSVPKIGLRAYNEYLGKASVRLEERVRGDVTLMFNVNRYGRPSRIRVTGVLTREAHQEAIRLLDNGPEWSPAAAPVTVVIRFE